MIESLKNFDRELFIFFNSQHNEFFDFIMYWASDRYIWIPFYFFLLYLVYKKGNVRTTLFILLGIAATITLCDQLSVKLFKEVFQRYRPCHNLELQHIVHLVNDKCGGKFGFVSSHATNVFGFASFLSLFFKQKKLALLLFSWAVFVSYSRIYLGVHYPADVAVGALLGLSIGAVVFWIVSRFLHRAS
jgi:undecaprenyl-diphosphatase